MQKNCGGHCKKNCGDHCTILFFDAAKQLTRAPPGLKSDLKKCLWWPLCKKIVVAIAKFLWWPLYNFLLWWPLCREFLRKFATCRHPGHQNHPEKKIFGFFGILEGIGAASLLNDGAAKQLPRAPLGLKSDLKKCWWWSLCKKNLWWPLQKKLW